MSHQTPHDSLFKAVMGEKEHALEYLRQELPAEILAHLDLSTLKRIPESFVDEELGDHHSDLLYQVELEGEPLLIYFLFEHKSEYDGGTPLQLLRYIVRIWERERAAHPGRVLLSPILPIVIFHGTGNWGRIRSLFQQYRGPRDLLASLADHLPDFEPMLKDLTGIPDEELKGTALLRMMLLLFKHARDPRLLELLPRWAATFHEVLRSSGWRSIRLVIEYILWVGQDASPEKVVEIFREDIRIEAKEEIMTIAEQLREEGRKEGQVDGSRSTVSKMMRSRFRTVPPAVAERVSKGTPEELDLWAERIFTATTAEEVVGM